MEKITGYSFGEAKGKPCKILNFSRCLDKDCSGIKDCGILKFGKVDLFEGLLRHKNGHTLWVIKNARVIRNFQKKIIGVIETVTDLSELKKARPEMEEASRRLGELNRLGGIIAKSQVMQNVFTFIKAAAASDTTILIQGESGTGKELVANAIHFIGERREEPMVIVNCSALSESLLESELFGHVKGAFTGANQNRIGRFEQADGGTVFLDEIGDITPYIQVKLPSGYFSRKRLNGWGNPGNAKLISGLLLQQTRILSLWLVKACSGRICITDSKCFPFACPPCGTGRKISLCWSVIL